MRDPSKTRELAEFIRDGLGCGCPDDVLADVGIDTQAADFSGLPVDAVLSVGGRLLVAVCARRPWPEIHAVLGSCVEAGRKRRDQGGYNRFRLVVVTDDADKAVVALQRRFEALPPMDDRLHLHVVEPSVVPELAG